MGETEIKSALSDFDALFLTIWAEARSETVEGQIAVGCVIRNRVKHPTRFGRTYAAVCLARNQFTCWNEGTDANHVKLMQLARAVSNGLPERVELQRDPVIRQAQWIARGIQSGDALDSTGGASHYLTKALYEMKPPIWAQGLPVRHIGSQVFMTAA